MTSLRVQNQAEQLPHLSLSQRLPSGPAVPFSHRAREHRSSPTLDKEVLEDTLR